jgi:hypothetical protein
MSAKKTYTCCVLVDASVNVTVLASSADEAADMAQSQRSHTMSAAIQEGMKWHSNIQSWARKLIARAGRGEAVSKPDLKMAKKIMELRG